MEWSPALILCAAALGVVAVLAAFGLSFRLIGVEDRVTPLLRRYRRPITVALLILWGGHMLLELAEDYREGDFGSLVVIVLVFLLYRYLDRVRGVADGERNPSGSRSFDPPGRAE